MGADRKLSLDETIDKKSLFFSVLIYFVKHLNYVVHSSNLILNVFCKMTEKGIIKLQSFL